MSLFLTAERQPVVGFTYLPARNGDRGASVGFLTVLRKLRALHADDPAGAARSAARIAQAVHAQDPPGKDRPGRELVESGIAALAAAYDRVRGGFGQGQKFPRPAA